jgi:hypothetical protein
MSPPALRVQSKANRAEDEVDFCLRLVDDAHLSFLLLKTYAREECTRLSIRKPLRGKKASTRIVLHPQQNAPRLIRR